MLLRPPPVWVAPVVVPVPRPLDVLGRGRGLVGAPDGERLVLGRVQEVAGRRVVVELAQAGLDAIALVQPLNSQNKTPCMQ